MLQMIGIEGFLLITFSFSVGIYFFIVISQLAQKITYRSPLQRIIGNREKTIVPALFKDKGKEKLDFGVFSDPKFMLTGFATACIFTWAFWTTPFKIYMFQAGLMVGFGVAKFLGNTKRTIDYRTKVKEISILYDSIDLFSDSHSIHQALAKAGELTPSIRDSVEKCVNRWPQGPVKALHHFAKEVNFPEAEILAAVLQHITLSGKSEKSGLLSEESAKLEERLRRNYEKEIAARPLYQTIYLALPGFALVGIVLFPIGYKAIKMIESLTAWNGQM
ncbi:hypothetical protein DCCM_3763 [Desulfocucumis palustris]|uniref:Type II secretion system protein GspF domain-containing protein n=1 Tax=Desulfocucumis palustris TaxID=1898651 RepID=A0A2L2XG07_9FIRM|nr:hypothetical protein [Desulfocucumis palustris]GBF34643.1 hypothetical protein DCCM_3763 [Desulfocucumis palustris]